MKKETLVGLVLGLFIVCAVVLYIWYAYVSSGEAAKPKADDNSIAQQQKKMKDTNIIAVFSENPVPQTQQSSPAPSEEVASASVISAQVSMPKEWKLVSEENNKSTCDTSLASKIITYEKDTQSITIYENSNPSGCDGKKVGDVTVPFSFLEDGTISIQESESYIQCTKEQSKSCPKGDGKVTVFVMNRDPATKNDVKNPINKATYAFKIDDTSISPDFSKQVNELVNIVKSVTLMY